MIPRAQALASCVFSCPPRRQMVGPDNLPFELNLTEFLMRSLRYCTAIAKYTHHGWGTTLLMPLVPPYSKIRFPSLLPRCRPFVEHSLNSSWIEIARNLKVLIGLQISDRQIA